MSSPTTSSATTPLVILGSARQAGDTHRLITQALAAIPHELVDLLDWSIAPYRYAQDYAANDAFLLLADRMRQHQTLVFATPVYWYSMSGVMKNFFDRFTDLCTTHKQLGRQLAGKRAFLLSVGSDQELPAGFEVPFRRTVEYFNMTFEGSLYHSLKQPFPAEEAHRFQLKMKN